ncbi:hypothetical protein ETH_00041720, partial [Eimeria tenella]
MPALEGPPKQQRRLRSSRSGDLRNNE